MPQFAGRPAFVAIKSTTDALSTSVTASTRKDWRSTSISAVAHRALHDQHRHHLVGAFSEDACTCVRGATPASLSDHGVVIWRLNIGGDSSDEFGDLINGVDAVAGGAGQNVRAFSDPNGSEKRLITLFQRIIFIHQVCNLVG